MKYKYLDLVNVFHDLGNDDLPNFQVSIDVIELQGDIAGLFHAAQGIGVVHHRLVRLSVGYTGTTEQRWTQLSEALKRVGVPGERQIA